MTTFAKHEKTHRAESKVARYENGVCIVNLVNIFFSIFVCVSKKTSISCQKSQLSQSSHQKTTIIKDIAACALEKAATLYGETESQHKMHAHARKRRRANARTHARTHCATNSRRNRPKLVAFSLSLWRVQTHSRKDNLLTEKSDKRAAASCRTANNRARTLSR